MFFFHKFSLLSLFSLALYTNAFSFINSHPFNISDCNECITEVKNIRQYNSSIVKLFNTLDNMCETLNLTECVSGLSSAEHWLLEENITKVCQDLGFCDNLTIDNYIMSVDSSLHLFRYYNINIVK